MPFICSKVTVKLSKEKEEILKSKLGKIITSIGKSENYLMIGFEDEYNLYFRGEKMTHAAFIEVKIFGTAPKKDLEGLTQKICTLYRDELDIPPDSIYVKYEEVSNWGYNNFNF